MTPPEPSGPVREEAPAPGTVGGRALRRRSPYVKRVSSPSGAPRTPACPAAAAPPGAGGGVQGGGAEPAHRAEAGAVRRRRRDVRTASQAAQVQGGRVVPAHAVQQVRQGRRGARGDEELGTAVRGGGDRPDRQAHPLQPRQGVAPGGLRHLDHVERPPHGQHHRGARELRPERRHLVQRSARADHRRVLQGVGARGPAARTPAGAGPGEGAHARHHVPAPQSRVLRHDRAVRGAAPPPRAGPDVTDAPTDADREAHAPSNGSDVPVVT